MSAEIVQMRSEPLLNDIAGQLRGLADRIESGDYGEVATLFAVMPDASGYPDVFAWGDVTGTNDPVIQFELAKMWLLTNLTERR